MTVSDRVFRAVVLTLLAVDGVISAVVGALLLPFSIGPVPVPISAVITGIVNMALVWAAMQWTDTLRSSGLPLWTWLLSVAVLLLGARIPGGDRVFIDNGMLAIGALAFVTVGALLPAWLLWRHYR